VYATLPEPAVDAEDKQLVKANGLLLMTIRGAELDTLKGQGLSVFATNRWALGNCQNLWGNALLIHADSSMLRQCYIRENCR
jgi:hypothetical protein